MTNKKFVGELQLANDQNYGFVILKDKNLGDVFISEKNLNTAFDGDKVEVCSFCSKKRKK